MIAWSRTRALIAGVSLILLTNAVALTGVAYNRSDPPESVLKLSQRELVLPYNWGLAAENSGLALRLQWRLLGQESEPGFYPSTGGGPAAWLDKAKLAELGFDFSQPESTGQSARQIAKHLAREVLVVLELDGTARQTALERARQHAAKEEAARVANPGNKTHEQRAKNAQEQLRREERENSRLFVVDAGLDLNVLRAKFPDRAKYGIVRGQVRPYVTQHDRESRLLGYISALSVAEITVPLDYRPIFEPVLKTGRTPLSGAALPYEVTVAFGKRLEPWVKSAQRK